MALTTHAVDLSTTDEGTVTIKKEKVDEEPAKQKHNKNLPPATITIDDPDTSTPHSVITVNPAVIQTSTSSETPAPAKPAPPAIDFASTCGAFGWTTIGAVHLPFIMRGEERFVAVRMVECKIINSYADILPWTVFTFTNIKSYYITDNEAKLLNEINGFHCEFQFGYQTFTSKDVVVRLKDTIKFYEFLETCKGKLNVAGANPIFADQCGYFLINYSPVPFVKKGTQRYVPLNMVYPEGMTPPMENVVEISEWDLAYLKFLCSVANLDTMKLSFDVQLCPAEELQTALGGIPFEEWWPNLQYSSKNDSLQQHSSSNGILPKWGDPVPGIHSAAMSADNTKNYNNSFNDLQEKDMLNQFFGLNKYLDMSTPIPKTTRSQDQQNLLNSITSNSLENFLATSSCNYPYPVNYRHHYTSHMQPDHEGNRKSSSALPPISFSFRSRPYPPPPPLVRVGSSSRISSVPGESGMVPKSAPAMYSYLPSSADTHCNPWLARMYEPDYLPDAARSVSVLPTIDGPENLSRRINDSESWSGITMNGAGSSNLHNSSVPRDSYEQQNHTSHPPGGSPRLLAGPGPPPHYPTPPQSSPLQPMPLVDCVNIPGVTTDIYGTRSTPNGLLDLCSPPPSPDTRTLASSPRGTHLSSYGYQPHITRLVQVDSRYVVAINMEPLKYNSNLAVPISDVVNKFLRGVSIQSCQIVLETVFGLHLYECSSLQLEALLKHNYHILPGNKLVLLPDLKNCIYQLKSLLLERDKVKDKHCDIAPPSELPLSKRWCGTAREC